MARIEDLHTPSESLDHAAREPRPRERRASVKENARRWWFAFGQWRVAGPDEDGFVLA